MADILKVLRRILSGDIQQDLLTAAVWTELVHNHRSFFSLARSYAMCPLG